MNEELLQGIHILNKTEIMKDNPLCFILFIAAIFLFIFAITSMMLECDITSIIFGILCIIDIIFLIIALAIGNPKTPTGKYTYQVTIDSSVSMTEFYNKHNIIKQEGEIYYIEEK